MMGGVKVLQSIASYIASRLETIFTMSCFTFVPTCKNGWHIVQLLGKKMAIAENAKQTTLEWSAQCFFIVLRAYLQNILFQSKKCPKLLSLA